MRFGMVRLWCSFWYLLHKVVVGLLLVWLLHEWDWRKWQLVGPWSLCCWVNGQSCTQLVEILNITILNLSLLRIWHRLPPLILGFSIMCSMLICITYSLSSCRLSSYGGWFLLRRLLVLPHNINQNYDTLSSTSESLKVENRVFLTQSKAGEIWTPCMATSLDAQTKIYLFELLKIIWILLQLQLVVSCKHWSTEL